MYNANGTYRERGSDMKTASPAFLSGLGIGIGIGLVLLLATIISPSIIAKGEPMGGPPVIEDPATVPAEAPQQKPANETVPERKRVIITYSAKSITPIVVTRSLVIVDDKNQARAGVSYSKDAGVYMYFYDKASGDTRIGIRLDDTGKAFIGIQQPDKTYKAIYEYAPPK